jgi:hypothetical protein
MHAFIRKTGNDRLPVPYVLPSPLAVFNAVFSLFWTARGYDTQAGNQAFYSASLWAVGVIYMQSFTVYMAMVCIPYTRFAWRVKAFLLFIVTAWWVQSWAWYSITGLLVADVAANSDFLTRVRQRLRIMLPFTGGDKKKAYWSIPSWLPCVIIMAAGLALELLQEGIGSMYEKGELKAHASSGSTDDSVAQPQAMANNYLLILGFALLVETQGWLQKVLGSRLLVEIGRRSLSMFHISQTLPHQMSCSFKC